MSNGLRRPLPLVLLAPVIGLAACAESYAPESEGDPTTVHVFEVQDGERTSLGTFDRQEGLDRASELAGYEIAVPENLPPVKIGLYSVSVIRDESGETRRTALAYLKGEEYDEGEPALYIEQPPPGKLLNPAQPGFTVNKTRHRDGCSGGDSIIEYKPTTTIFLWDCGASAEVYIVRDTEQSFRIESHAIGQGPLLNQVVRDIIGVSKIPAPLG